MHQPNKKITLLAAAVTATLGISTVHASGFRIPEISVLGLGTSNALVANTDELGALPYNPANMAFHDKNGLVAGVTYIGYDLKVDTTVQVPPGGPNESTGKDSFWVPNLYAMAPGYGNVSFGLGINAPFGLETNWAAGTFPNFGLTPAEQAWAPELSRIQMINVNPNFAFKFNDTTSLAIGLDFYDVRDLGFHYQGFKISGSGSGLGWNIGFTKKVGTLNLGLSYRSSVDADVSGTYAGAVTAKATVPFPDLLQLGAYFQATDNIGLEFDIEHIGWSSFDKIEINTPLGTSSSTNNWDDTWAYRLGLIIALNPNTKLLLGYSYDETGQTDEYFSARVPDNDRQLLSIGVTHDVAGWTLEASYMHAMVDDRTFSGTAYGGPGTDPNGTDAYDGKYESNVNLLGIGLSTKF